MSLRDRYLEALAAAEARDAGRGGASEIVRLQKGAAFRVWVKGRRVRVQLRREYKPVGYPTEEATFCKHFGIPPTATREEPGRDGSWYTVVYDWERPEPAPAGEAAEQLGML